MDKQYIELGKVSLTSEGFWSREKSYERLSIVTDEFTGASYVSKKDIHPGIELSNCHFWQPLGSHTARNNNFIILSDKDEDTGELKIYTLETAIQSINPKDRNPGLVLGFFGIDYAVTPHAKTWFLYQFESDNIEEWNDIHKWDSLYNNVNKFRGFYHCEADLIRYAIRPTVGDHAFVGEDMEKAILYMCLQNGKWTNTHTPAYEFTNLYEGVNSKDFDDFEYNVDEKYSDRAEKDSLGRIIHFTYVTREGLSNYVFNQIAKAISEINLPEGCINLEHLSKSLVDYISSMSVGGTITNMPDEEDLTTKQVNGVDVIQFKDRPSSASNFSSIGKKYLRKNMVDGINVLEPYMISEPNTIYVISYDYCLNDAYITLPENSTLQFEGGTINGGSLFMNDTKVVGVFTEDEIGINLTIEGYYKVGQRFYDIHRGKMKYFNGSNWTDALGNYFINEL